MCILGYIRELRFIHVLDLSRGFAQSRSQLDPWRTVRYIFGGFRWQVTIMKQIASCYFTIPFDTERFPMFSVMTDNVTAGLGRTRGMHRNGFIKRISLASKASDEAETPWRGVVWPTAKVFDAPRCEYDDPTINSLLMSFPCVLQSVGTQLRTAPWFRYRLHRGGLLEYMQIMQPYHRRCRRAKFSTGLDKVSLTLLATYLVVQRVVSYLPLV